MNPLPMTVLLIVAAASLIALAAILADLLSEHPSEGARRRGRST